jgi:hypothetical protein
VATTSPTQTWWSKVRLPPGEVTRISESMMRAEASACLEVGEHWVRQIDGLRFDLSTERLCLSPGSHHILLADGSSFEVELAQGTIELSSTLRSPAPVAPWVFWLTSGGALTGGAVAIGVGASARSSVIEAKQDPEGRIISQSQREAFEAQARGRYGHDSGGDLGVDRSRFGRGRSDCLAPREVSPQSTAHRSITPKPFLVPANQIRSWSSTLKATN